MTSKSCHQHDDQLSFLLGWVFGVITWEQSLLSKIEKKKCFVKKWPLFPFIFSSGHFEWLEANDNALYENAYPNSSMCHCSSKYCHFQFHYSTADSSALKAVLLVNQVRRNTCSFPQVKHMAARVLPDKMQEDTPAATCLSPELVCAKSNVVPFHWSMQLQNLGVHHLSYKLIWWVNVLQ